MAQQLATDADGRLIIDVRGPRFGAALTTAVLATALVVQGSLGLALVAWQWLAFGISAIAGLRYSPYGRLFRVLKRRLALGPPPATEPEAPPRFAQLAGFLVATVALVLHVIGAVTAAWIAVGIVLALSALLAFTGLCIGCELYLVGRRLLGGRNPR
jgi:hypothetical protein